MVKISISCLGWLIWSYENSDRCIYSNNSYGKLLIPYLARLSTERLDESLLVCGPGILLYNYEMKYWWPDEAFLILNEIDECFW